jgi:alkylhydroperoxidase family enzyme
VTEHRDVPLLSDGDAVLAATEAGVPEYMADLNVFKVLLRRPRVGRALNDLIAGLIFKGTLDARLRELIIMRVAWLAGSSYEWSQHWALCERLGIPSEDIVGVRDWPSHPGFDEVDQAALSATDEALSGGYVTPATRGRCLDALGGDPDLLLELLAAIGNWSLFAFLLRSLEVPLDDDLLLWPPDGIAPEGSDR